MQPRSDSRGHHESNKMEVMKVNCDRVNWTQADQIFCDNGDVSASSTTQQGLMTSAPVGTPAVMVPAASSR